MEAYLGPYEWKQYNILVAPTGFPYGGMENPCLTFVTPALLAGDKSLISTIAHELSHSWSGNLVTNKNWRNFWLNEGLTVFLERKIIEIKFGKDMALLQASVGYRVLMDDIKSLGEDNTFTSLYPEIGKVKYFKIRMILMMLLAQFLTKKASISYTFLKSFLKTI